MRGRPFRRSLAVVLAVIVAPGLVVVPGTEATPTRRRHASASALPALPSDDPVVAHPRRPSSTRHKRVLARRSLAAPPAASPLAPADAAVVSSTTPTLAVGPVVDPDGDPVTYRFKVTTKPDAESGTIVADTVVPTASLTLPEGAVRDGLTYFWHAYAADAANPSGTAPGWVRSFRVDLGLGASASAPFDRVGGLGVNLVSGNLVLSASTASVGSLAGPVGVSFTYNSRTPAQPGLLGSYTRDADGDRVWDAGEEPAVVRRDPSVAFDWGSEPPAPGLPTTDVLVRWRGFVRVPVTGSYQFGATTSGGVRIRVDGTLVVDSWTAQSPGAPVYQSSITLSEGSPVPITVEWFKGGAGPGVLKLHAKGAVPEALVDPSWLSGEAGPLPLGWALAPLGGGGPAYVRAEVSDREVVLVGPDGDTHVYTSTGTGYTPPKGEDGVLARDSAGLLTLDATDGATYVFDASGALRSATSSSASPASHRYGWVTPSGSSLPRLATITDPVSNRAVTLRYGGDSACSSSAPPRFDAAAPGGMLCAVELWDGRATTLWYVGGRLGRIENPGAAVTDFGYDGAGRIERVRDPLAADMVAAGRADDDTTRTVVAYDGSGRVSSVTLGAPSAAAARPGRSYEYVSATETQVDVAGLSTPHGWARRVTFDARGRQLTDTDATNRTTSTVWDTVADRVVAAVDAAGLRSTTVYDHAGRPTDSYGPAPASWFGPDERPLPAFVSQVPHSTTAYDEDLRGLDVVYFANPSWSGAPAGHTFRLPGAPDGTVQGDFGAGVPVSGLPAAWSARLTGELRFPSVGTYTLAPNALGPTRVYVDDVKVVDTATAPTGTYANAVAGSRHRLRIEYSTPGGSSQVPGTQTFTSTGAAQSWTVPAGTTAVTVEAWGAAGQATGSGAAAGLGGYAKATIPVAAGESLQVNVGGVGTCGTGNHLFPGAGGWNGGGTGGRGGCGGGGASDVRRGGTALTDRKVVAGGGGAGSADGSFSGYPLYAGGAGGGTAGGSAHYGSAGGSQSAGGAVNHTVFLPGSPGTFGAGGAAAMYEWGGGGGAGWYGGAGGYGYYPGGGSGGGGSGYVSGTATSMSGGVRSGAGQVVLSWTSSASLDLRWTPPGGTEARVPGTELAPRYGLVTTTTDPDGRVTAIEHAHPELGLATTSIVDPSGLNLRTRVGYEAPGTGFQRRLWRALPKVTAAAPATDHRTNDTWYGATEVRTNPCPGGTATSQAGLRKLLTGPDPDGAGAATARVDEQVHDAAGRVVATRVQGGAFALAWACVDYDARDRIVGSSDRDGRTTAVTYALDGTTTVVAQDSGGTARTTSSTVDLLGRTLTSTDELGTRTRVAYDQAGRVISTHRAFVGQAEAQLTSTTYDAAGRVLTTSDHLTGSARTTTATYDGAGRPDGMVRPNGVATTVVYDGLGRREQLLNAPGAGASSATFTATGAAQSWTAPAGVGAVTVEAWGAQGGGSTAGSTGAPDGGKGGYAKATIPLGPAASVQVNVGGSPGVCGYHVGDGGWNGGGAGMAYSAGSGCGGGGASDVRVGGTALADRKVVAGGGGAAGRPHGSSLDHTGGAGGGAEGGTSNTLSGIGGSQTGGGAQRPPIGWAYRGAAGTLGQGGAAGGHGGGGGGGFHGGAGGDAHDVPGHPGGGGSGLVTGVGTSMATGVRPGPGQVTLTWDALPDTTVTYSTGGRVVAESTDARVVSYTYDAAGRLTAAVDATGTRRYAYDANSNRCGLAVSCQSGWAYDAADRITASPYASSYAYDTHGNLVATTGTGGNPSATMTYDANGHATVVEDGTTRVAETLTASGRVLRRVVTALATSTVVEDVSFGYAGDGDSPAYSRPTSGGAVTTYLGELTDVGGTPTWSLVDGRGSVLGTTDASGAFATAPDVDEFGVGPAGPNRYGWLGLHQRAQVGVLGVYRMGVRLYDPRLGRFTSVDPIEGGSCNDYDYVCGDPVNAVDLDGTELTFVEFYARLSLSAESFGNNWVQQIYDNSERIAQILVLEVNKHTGRDRLNPMTGIDRVSEVAWQVEEITGPVRRKGRSIRIPRTGGVAGGTTSPGLVVGGCAAGMLFGVWAGPFGAVGNMAAGCGISTLGQGLAVGIDSRYS